MDAAKFMALAETDLEKLFPTSPCRLCPKPIKEGDELQRYYVNGKPVFVHADCYWDEFSKEIEARPICSLGRPRIRGCA
jgi:hypothetical protein